jgi:hypothetical protein
MEIQVIRMSLFGLRNLAVILVIAAGLMAATSASCGAFTPSFGQKISGDQLNLSGSGDAHGRALLSGRSEVILLSMGTAALIARSSVNDERIAKALRGAPFEGVLDAGDAFGYGLGAGLGALGVYAAGRMTDSRTLSTTGLDLCKSLALTWGSVWALKLLIDADRPGGGDYSFPSGHTATAFAVASVLSGHFGWKVGVPAYVLATGTGLARVEERRHYSRDVIFGAAIGLVVGSEVTSRSRLGAALEHVEMSDRGLGLRVQF